MIPKYKQRSFILDQLHRGVVSICIFTTIFAGAVVLYRGYYYYRHVRPALLEVQMKANEELLEEGKYIAVSS